MTEAHVMASNEPVTAEQLWAWLEAVPDPEIPVVSLRELGILREIQPVDGGWEVVITPTYTGCPAMSQIEDDVKACLAERGVPGRVVTRLSPAWTTDWIGPEAREKLRAYGIAPPSPTTGDPHAAGHACGLGATAGREQVVQWLQRSSVEPDVACPRCGSVHTVELSRFSSTACKALYRCLDCREPFDLFKPY